jgi:hypothetical protein
MDIKKEFVCLSIVAMLMFCLPNAAATPIHGSTYSNLGAHLIKRAGAIYPLWEQDPGSPKLTDPSIHITIKSYPKQVNVGQHFSIDGCLMRGNTGIGNAEIRHLGEDGFLWTVNTKADGSFTDTFYFKQQGVQEIMYSYWGSDKTDLYLSDMIWINVISK